MWLFRFINRVDATVSKELVKVLLKLIVRGGWGISAWQTAHCNELAT
jgi:hypothetical protein